MSTSKLFQPITVGNLSLQNRVVLAPMTRCRSSESGVPYVDLMKEYYSQRASAPGTLLVSEGVFIAEKAGSLPNVPGVWDDEQLTAWKGITDGVHESGSFIYAQLWALGRAGYEAILSKKGYPYVSSSNVQLTGKDTAPRPLTKEEIAEYVQLYATAAKNAVEKGGFDGVEIHSANGYLLHQFLHDTVNQRTDEYGGSIENRCRFALEVTAAVVDAIGAERTGIRISPWNSFQDMTMKDPIPQFSHLASELKARHPTLAFLHSVEARSQGFEIQEDDVHQSNDFLRKIWNPKPFIIAGAFDRDSAISTADEKGDLIAFGRPFISNPDLVRRLRENIPLAPYNRDTFYLPGEVALGYTDYPFAESN